MITSLTLENFKSFENTTIHFGAVTTLIGTNASGKSNVKDAIRVLHGISRGYTLAEAIGEKWGEGGVSEWKGIRGGTREIIYSGSDSSSCKIKIEFTTTTISKTNRKPRNFKGYYSLEIGLTNGTVKTPHVIDECLHVEGYKYNYGKIIWVTKNSRDSIKAEAGEPRSGGPHKQHTFRNDKPILTQYVERDDIAEDAKVYARGLIQLLKHIRFLDVSPDAMRQPSLPGQKSLSDRGENLSSVLQSIFTEERAKKIVLHWLTELTPQEVSDFSFSSDMQGKILLNLIDTNGQSISAYSASDGTLRYLAMVAALFSPDLTMSYFLEEVENGIHPSRLRLLVQLMEQRSKDTKVQLILSTHSPLLLEYLSQESRQNVSLVYRLTNHKCSKVKKITEIPNFQDVTQNQRVSELHSSNWFENVLEFLEDGEDEF